MGIECEHYGVFVDGDQNKDVKQYTFSNSNGLKVKVISYGAGISDVVLPDKNGAADHVVLGFDALEGFVKNNYIGSTVGRYANRIGGATYVLDGNTVHVSKNKNEDHLHGGERGWHQYVWESEMKEDAVVFSLVTPDGDMGYPGTAMAQVTYSLSDDGSFQMEFQAMSSKATAINMTNHAFFNLAGHASGEKGLHEHNVQIRAEHYLPMNPQMITTGEVKPVTGTLFDLRETRNLGKALTEGPDGGFDHCFVAGNRGTLKCVAKVTHPKSGRCLTVCTTEPGTQFYTGNFIPKDDGVMVGRDNTSYTYRGAFCLEPENYPDAPNKSHFPSSILYPGDLYKHTMIYKFETLA